jgi:hypothetical protein
MQPHAARSTGPVRRTDPSDDRRGIETGQIAGSRTRAANARERPLVDPFADRLSERDAAV